MTPNAAYLARFPEWREVSNYELELLPGPTGPCQTRGCDHLAIAKVHWEFSQAHGEKMRRTRTSRWACEFHAKKFAEKHNLYWPKEEETL